MRKEEVRRRQLILIFFLLLVTQKFLCQIVEHGGFYRMSDHTWVTIERYSFKELVIHRLIQEGNHYHTGMGVGIN